MMQAAVQAPHASWLSLAWRALTEPSLVRRLLVAQMGLLALLWTGVFIYAATENGTDTPVLKETSVYHAIATVADHLADSPARQYHSLAALDRAIHQRYAEAEGVSELAPGLLVLQRSAVVYRSPHLPQGAEAESFVANAASDAVRDYDDGRLKWRVRVVADVTGARVAMFVPRGGWHMFITLASHGYYLAPMVISLPFLLLPAWLSIRLALRPWRQVAQEVASRGPQDLAPLSYRGQHQELAAMVDSIDALMARVAEASARERSFIADAAHELRTPLAAMRVNVEALHGQTWEWRQRELLEGIISSGNRAARLVSQLLVLMRSDAAASRIDAGARVQLDELLQDRLAVLSGLAASRGVELELQAAAGVAIDGWRESLVSLADNLVDNAIKYSPHGGVVRVGLWHVQGWAVLSVEDQGPGIAPELRSRVFDRFYRAPKQTQGGSGLGLAIALAAARLHGGRIELLDGEQGGLKVNVWLPAP
ncbi:ATP-binding protein [Pseudoduganella ginsengisoli]|uniref:histidine kinase n=1 Tax=Pseudoduganella ginsengisoli TaxID=1462440 RepID=A0A6L6Q5P4_9BURK|nr:ATP-binding protein [Pseudoduganella ginsengisoli]MTW04724.1 sensor histidine kinase [Pseudoduganella ginsengisoli]